MGCRVVILLDTHVLIWLDSGDRQLGRETRQLVDSALQEDALAVSAITFWETAMLVERQRIALSVPTLVWRHNLLSNGLREIPISGEIGVMAATLSSFHGDPADRLITATALAMKAQLTTTDRKILDWGDAALCLDARQ